ncbi:hypothetical protein DFP72DRAFT_927282 [Ephemerocybe angulata]|uniref:Uncharacterized protein n=1 Tax=Ephemerocybe angulata TaxID=980116 RepID=A0A8H6LV24_9AGAR|nr:hypothetical protein DFP72DRAFT_927282 [Tulosesus angulatus]
MLGYAAEILASFDGHIAECDEGRHELLTLSHTTDLIIFLLTHTDKETGEHYNDFARPRDPHSEDVLRSMTARIASFSSISRRAILDSILSRAKEIDARYRSGSIGGAGRDCGQPRQSQLSSKASPKPCAASVIDSSKTQQGSKDGRSSPIAQPPLFWKSPDGKVDPRLTACVKEMEANPGRSILVEGIFPFISDEKFIHLLVVMKALSLGGQERYRIVTNVIRVV